MKKDRLVPYIFVSCLIHAGVLIGAHQFLKLPAKELELAELIPVEMVVEREDSPASQPELAPGDRIMQKKVLQTKSRIVMETIIDRSEDDITTPVPKAGGFEPSVAMAGRATTVFIAEVPAVENADSKPLTQTSQILPSPISPVAPTTPTESVLLEVRVPAVLVEAEAKLTPADSQTPQRVASPMPGSRSAAEPVFEPPALASKSNDEPRLTLNPNPMMSDVPGVPEADTIAVKPLILASQNIPSQVSPVNPSEQAESSQWEVKIPVALVRTETKLTPADSQTPQRVATPISGTRSAVEPVFKPPPVSTERHDQPRLKLDTNPTLRYVSGAPEAETVAGKSVIPSSQVSPLQVSPADPSPPLMSTPLDVRMAAIPIEAKAATIPPYPQSPQKVETLLVSRRPREDLAAEYQPIPSEGDYEPALMVSTLQVQSQPNGAQVYVNGMSIGETPLAWELPLGKHEVRLALPDYYDWKAQIELTEKHKTLPIFFRLLPVE